MQHQQGKNVYVSSQASCWFAVQMIDFGLADFREVFGAGYVTGKRTLIHNEPHHMEPLQHADSRAQANGGPGQGELHEHHDGGPGGGHHHMSLRGNKGISKRSDAVPAGSKNTKFFPTPSNLLPQVRFFYLH